MGPFWGCTGYPTCKTTRYDVDGVPSKEADEHYRCPVCTRSMIRTSDKRGFYWFCTGYNKGCKVTLRDDDGRPETAFRCKSCGQLLIKRRGKKGKFWGCSQYPTCTTTYSDKDGKPNFDIFTS
jgi:ssDNA-binding Zn-finger/Zn-ribbon topoisomerase 1